MPAQPRWLNQLDSIIAELQALPDRWLDRQTIQDLLGVKARRAQQIAAPCVSRTVGTSALIDRDSLIQQLRRLQAGEAGAYERLRRQRVARMIQDLGRQRIASPVVQVEAPMPIVNQTFDGLPAGVDLAPGRILIRFDDPKEALEKLLALAMAVGNDYERFEAITGIPE